MNSGSRPKPASNDREDKCILGLTPNTELCVDLKTYLRGHRVAKVGHSYVGMLKRDNLCHFTFVETTSSSALVRRNECVYHGKYVNIRRTPDGTPLLTFHRPHLNEKYRLEQFLFQAADELYYLASLIEEDKQLFE